MADNLKSLRSSQILHFCAGITYFIAGLIANFVQLILLITISPFDKQLFRRINYYISFCLHSHILFLAEWWSDMDCSFYVNKNDFHTYFGKEHALCVLNHSYEIDFVVHWMVAQNSGCLGNLKCYAKTAVKYIPIFGWCLRISENIFLDRNIEKDKGNITKQLETIFQYESPVWLILYPEGTRFTEEKHAASLKYAKENNVTPLKHHLIPRTKGFIVSVPALKEHNVAIYDVTAVFSHKEAPHATFKDLFQGRKLHPHIIFERIPCENIPDDPAGQDKFMKDLYAKKDKLRDSFLTTGNFSNVPEMEKLSKIELKKSFPVWIIVVACNLLVAGSICYFLLHLLLAGKFLTLLFCCILLLALYLAFEKMVVDQSKFSKSSSYGTTVQKNKEVADVL